MTETQPEAGTEETAPEPETLENVEAVEDGTETES